MYGVDHVGHGLSEGETQYIESIWALRDDILYLVEHIVRPKHPKLPIFIHGHSMGGLLTILAVQKKSSLFTATYLEAPLIIVHPSTGSPFLKKVAKALSFLPKFAAPGTKLKLPLLTNNASMLTRWASDTLRKSKVRGGA